MAAHKPSPHTSYRHARARLADLEALRDKLARSRPRTSGKKAAKTRQLNRLARRIPAAKGLLTKARNAIAKAAATRTTHKRSASQKRSDAAKRGWSTRRAKASQAPVVPAAIPAGKALPWLTYEKGVVGVWPPSKDDRSKPLSRRGWIVTLKPSPAIDVLATKPDSQQTINIQVKTRSPSNRQGWVLHESIQNRVKGKDFYIAFVDLVAVGEKPDYYIIPKNLFATWIRRQHRDWLATPGRLGRQHVDNPTRTFSKTHFILFERYHNNWGILESRSRRAPIVQRPRRT